MAYSFVDNITGYNKDIQTAFYVGSKTSVLTTNEKMFTEEFDEIKVREIGITGGAGDYAGQYQATGGTASVKWNSYRASEDRYFQLTTDSMTEVASYLAGTKPSIIAAYEAFINQAVAPEVDAVTIAACASAAVKAGNTISASKFKTEGFNYIVDVLAQLYNKGVDSNRLVYFFVRSDIYATLQKLIIDKNGLANGAVLKEMTLSVGDTGLEVNTEIIKYQNAVLINMPDVRMWSKVDLLDGRSAGQELGGFKPAEGAEKLSCVAVPDGAAFVDARYNITNMLFPSVALQGVTPAEIDEAISKLGEGFKVDNIGVNQKANGFEINARVIYGADAFKINADKILAFTE